MKIRGNALQVLEKYQALARDALASGDRIAAENYLQHAEHYYRIYQANMANNPAANRGPNGAQPSQPETAENEEADGQTQAALPN